VYSGCANSNGFRPSLHTPAGNFGTQTVEIISTFIQLAELEICLMVLFLHAIVRSGAVRALFGFAYQNENRWQNVLLLTVFNSISSVYIFT
jgi:hypothetical protein